MIFYLKRPFFSIILMMLLQTGTSRAQIVLTPSTGCAPLTVNFAGPPGASNFWWNLGGNNTTTTTAAPSNLYHTPGTYNITYTALVNGSPVSYSAQLVVSSPPSGSFSFTLPSTHCKPMAVKFAGTGGSQGSTYQWAFGDLTALGTGASPTHTFTTAGTYTPVMIIYDAVSSCTAVASNQSGVIYVSDPPVIVIDADPGLTACNKTLVASFSGSASISGSPKGGSLSGWNWTFVGGVPGTGTGQNPGSASFAQGQHTVFATATDNNKCSGSASVHVNVTQVDLNLPATSTVCIGYLYLMTYTSPGLPSYWTEPGGTPTLVPYPNADTLIMNTPGLNTITVSVYPPAPCPAITDTFQIFVEQVISNFTSTPGTSCNGTLVGTYSHLASTNTGYSLNFLWKLIGASGYNTGVPTQTTGPSATFTFYQHTTNHPYNIYPVWNPTIQLVAQSTSPASCTSQTFDNFFHRVQRPTSWFYTDVKEGCAPLKVMFMDSSKTLLPPHPITGYTIFSGQGSQSLTSPSNTIFPVSFTYSATGTYSAYMLIETAGGCVDSSFLHEIIVVDPPNVSLTFTPSVVCAGQPVQLNLSATPSSSLIQHWHITTDQGVFSGCVSDPSPVYPFSHTGTQGFTLHAFQNGCEGITVPSQSITVRGPYGKARISASCLPGQRKTIVVHSHLQEVSTAQLDFGDGSPPLQLAGNPAGVTSLTDSHTYTNSGNYILTLTSSNNVSGCSPHTFTTLVKVRDPQARITFTDNTVPSGTLALGCVGKSAELSAVNSTDAYVGCERGYTWKLSTASHTFPPIDTTSFRFFPDTFLVPDIFTLVLSIKDENECVDDDTIYFRSSMATPDFTFSSNPLCLSQGSVQMVNVSQNHQHPDDQIVASVWRFGDGSAAFSPTNATGSIVHQYNTASSPSQMFEVVLTVTNSAGCVDSVKKHLQVNNPLVNLQASQWFPCIPKDGISTVSLSANAGYQSYSINPGLPGFGWYTGSQNSQSYPYFTPGIFEATITIADNVGCRSTEVRTVTAIGQPTAQIRFADDANKFCLPATPTLVSISKENITAITNTIWTIGNSKSPPPGADKLNYIFTSTGLHTVALTVDVSGFCPSTTTAAIIVSDPRANVNISKNRLCLGDTLKVSLFDTNSVEGWRWFFGDFVPQQDLYAGSPLALFHPTLSYPYNILPSDSAGKTIVSLRYFGTQGSCPRTATTGIQVVQLSAGFQHDLDNYRHCLGEQDAFSAIVKNPYSLPLLFNWDFGDSNQASGRNVVHSYNAPGTYTVTLDVKDSDIGCRDTSMKIMSILPLPRASLSFSDELVCPGANVILFGSATPGETGVVTGTLVPAATFTFNAENTFTAIVSAAQTTTYTIEVTDENLCKSPPSFAVLKILEQPVPIRWDTVIVVGQTVQLNAYIGSNFTYTWGPVTTSLNCLNCYNPVSTTTTDITYSVTTTDDSLQCFNTEHVFRIVVTPLVSLDVPTAFTPNGDGVNDIIYPDGWGLKKLLYFRIYNRWGQLLYETNDLEKGWDGRFNGEPQNMETYVYQVAAETLTDVVLSKSGSFKLLR